MKNLLYVLTAFLIFSCSSSDEGLNKSDFNPPAWIQGTWNDEFGSGAGFKFSTNNIIILVPPSEQSLQGLITLGRTGGQTATVEETISNTSYSAKLNFYGGQSTTYTFNKLSDTELEYEPYGGAVIFVKQ